MNRKWLALTLMVLGAGFSASASLQFTNISVKFFPSFTNQLEAVASGGVSNFVAVGDHTAYVAGNFVPTQPFINPANWTTNTIGNSVAAGSNLFAVASSGKFFLASGNNNLVFSSTNGTSWSTNYSRIFSSTARAYGMAYNNGNFVTVASAAGLIGYTNATADLRANWPLSTFDNLSFAESYRGVTAFGSSNFAACGIFGLVRISTNSGVSWQYNNGSIGQPDLYSIAYDNAKTFVSVGATNASPTTNGTGMILVSTNRSGTNWQVAYFNPTNNTPIKSVAYTGTGFIAVGSGGLILVSSNGLSGTWTQVPNNNANPITYANGNFANSDLNGVAFASGGYMHDVGEIVGANGNVILAAEPPPTNNSLGNKWICVGVTTVIWAGVTNTLPANTLQVTNAWGTNVVTVDWYDINGLVTNGTTFITNGMFSFTPPFDTDNSQNTTNHYWAQARDLRTGFVNTNKTEMVLTNFMRPTAANVSTTAICNGDSTVLQANLAGNGPWTVTWSDGFTNFVQTVGTANVYLANNPFTNWLTIPNGVFNPTNLFPNCPSNHQYWVTTLSDTYFPTDEPAILNPSGTNWAGDLTCTNGVTVNPRPTARVTTTNTICNGDSQVLKVNLTGTGPWQVTWTDGINNYTQTVPFTSEGPCDNSLVTVGNLTIPAFDNPFNPTNVLLNAATNYAYWVIAVTDANSCSGNRAGDITGTARIKVNPRPTATLVTTNTICNGASQVLQANLTGLGPWTVYWTDGFTNYTQAVSVNAAGPYTDTLTIPNGVFNPTNVFPNLPTNHYYWVTSVADSNCMTYASDITGTNLVTVNPRPTASLVTAQTICNGQSALVQLKANLTGIGPWSVTWSDGFVQTTNAALGSGVAAVRGVTSLEVTNLFANNPTNYTFTVTSVTNADSCLGNRPGDLTCTNTITVNPRPTASMFSFNTTNCNEGSFYTLTNTLTGTGPWTVSWNDGFNQTNFTAGPGPASLLRTVYPTNSFGANGSTNNVFYVTNIVDANSCIGNQPGDITGTVTNTVAPRPTASLLSFNATNCDDGTLRTLTNTLTGTGPWTVYWNDGTVQVTENTGAGPATLLRTVHPTVIFGANTASNNVYYVTNVVDADGCMGDQLGDVSGAVTNTVNPRPTAVLASFNMTACNVGTVYTFTNTLTGIGPWTVVWNDGYSQTTNVSLGSPATMLRTVVPGNPFANVASNNVFYVAAVSNADTCVGNLAGDITGTNVVTINPRPKAALSVFNANDCDDGTNSYDLTTTLTGIGPWTVVWNDGYSQTTNVSLGSPVTLYRTVYPTNSFRANTASTNIYYLTTVSNADTCVGNLPGDITGTNVVIIYPRPTAVLAALSATNCNDGTSFSLTNTLTGIGPWIVTWNDGIKQTNLSLTGPTNLVRTVHPTNSFGVNIASNNVFYVIGVSNTDMCLGNFPGDITGTNSFTINPRPTALLAAFSVTNCNDGTTFPLTNTLTGIGPWTVVWNDGYSQTTNVSAGNSATLIRTVSPTNSFGANTVSTNVYYVTNVTDINACVGNKPGDIKGTNVVTIRPQPTVALQSFNTTNCNDGTSFQLTNILTGIGPWTVYWNDGSSQTTNKTGPGPVTLKRTVYPTNSFAVSTASNNVYYVIGVSNADSCVGSLPGDLTGTNILTINPRPTAIVSGTTNIFVSGTNLVTTLIQADLTGVAPWTFTWSDGVVQTTNASPAIRDFTTNLLNQTYNNYTLTNYPHRLSLVTNTTAGAILQNNGSHSNQWYVTFGSDRYYFIATNTVNASSIATRSFVFAIQSLSDANCSANGTNDLAGVATVTLSPGPAANVFAASLTNLCQGQPVELQATLSGTPPWTVYWSDGHQQTVTNNPAVYDISTTNLSGTLPPYTITNLTDAVTNAVATNLTGSVTITVYVVPTNTPVSTGYQTNCAGVANPPLVVTDTNAVDWYDTNGTIVASGTNSFTPPDTAPGSWAYFAAEVNTNGCAGPTVQVELLLLSCSNPPAISLSGTNGTIKWFGNLTLQSSTNLAPPNWQDVTQGTFTNGLSGTNLWHWTNGVPPWTNPYNFFRLNTN